MPAKMILTGDLNLMNVDRAEVPFARVADEFRDADVVFSNLECCLVNKPADFSELDEGFYASPGPAGDALRHGGVQAVGIANNVNYGKAPILASVARLDELGIAHTGAGANLEEAQRPVILTRDGVRYGFVQRSCAYWPTHQEARADTPGIAVIKGHTAYHVPIHRVRPGARLFNRPGVAPEIVTWADREHLADFVAQLAALRREVDVLVASVHWGLDDQVLGYMEEIGRAAVDAGADLVMGHGPHYVLPVETYKGKHILYSLGSFSFHTGHAGHKHGDWLGLMARVDVEGGAISRLTCQFVRHNDANETYLCGVDRERKDFEKLARRSAAYGTKLTQSGEEILVAAAEGIAETPPAAQASH